MADGAQSPLLSLRSSSPDQASTSKQQFSLEQPLYGASGSRDDIFSLGGTSYITSAKNSGSRALGCVSEMTTENFSFLPVCPASHTFRSLLLTAGQPC